MPEICTTKDRLVTESYEATQAYGTAAEELYKAAGDNQDNFKALLTTTKGARLKCERARTVLHTHRTEHGC